MCPSNAECVLLARVLDALKAFDLKTASQAEDFSFDYRSAEG